MKNALKVFLLLVVLAAPAMAAPRDDDPRRGRDGINRIVQVIKRLVHTLDDLIAGPPKP